MRARCIPALIVALSLVAVPVWAGSWSLSTPYGSTSGTIDPSAVTVSSSGNLSVSSTAVDWTFSLDKASTTVSGSASVNDQDYSGSLDWSGLFDWLFG